MDKRGSEGKGKTFQSLGREGIASPPPAPLEARTKKVLGEQHAIVANSSDLCDNSTNFGILMPTVKS